MRLKKQGGNILLLNTGRKCTIIWRLFSFKISDSFNGRVFRSEKESVRERERKKER